jgi:hypothetical protein
MQLEDVLALRKKLEDAKSRADRAEGAVAQSLRELKEKWGCSSIQEAKAKLDDLGLRHTRSAAKYDEALREFKRRYATELD